MTLRDARSVVPRAVPPRGNPAPPAPAPPLPPPRCAGCGKPVPILPVFIGGRYFCDLACLERFRDAIARAQALSPGA